MEQETSILLSLPRDIWIHNICYYFFVQDLKRLRLISKWFQNLINSYPTWNLKIPFSGLESYETNYDKFKWKKLISACYFSQTTPLTKENFALLPKYIKELDLSKSSVQTGEILKGLPPFLDKVILPWQSKLSPKDIEFLLVNFPNTTLEFYSNCDVLFWACREGNLELVQNLIENLGCLKYINALNGQYYKTPLFSCCFFGNLKMVKYLLQKGANPNIGNEKPGIWTPLTIATKLQHVEIVGELLKYGAKDNKKNRWGETGLDIAKFQKNQQLINLLTPK